jgi:hypothetical protein
VDVKKGGDLSYLSFEVLPIKNSKSQFERLLSYKISVTLKEQTANANQRTLSFADHSVLSEGTWYKLAIAKDGVYKIDKNLLNQLGIQTNDLNPAALNIYGNGGELLPFSNQVPRADDLVQNSVFVFENVQNGKFDDNDYVLFYGKGPDTWDYSDAGLRYEHNKHFYTDSAYYFLRIDDLVPNRIQNAPDVSEQKLL